MLLAARALGLDATLTTLSTPERKCISGPE
jgi:hypothetical protein